MEQNNCAPLNPTHYPDDKVKKHCQKKGDLYSPDSGEDEAVKALEDEFEDAVARYAEDNLLVVRVRKPFTYIIGTEFLSQVFLKDPYYQKMTRDRTMSGNSFFGSAGGWLGLCCGLSVISMLEIGYHGILFIVAICKGREMSHVNYEK